MSKYFFIAILMVLFGLLVNEISAKSKKGRKRSRKYYSPKFEVFTVDIKNTPPFESPVFKLRPQTDGQCSARGINEFFTEIYPGRGTKPVVRIDCGEYPGTSPEIIRVCVFDPKGECVFPRCLTDAKGSCPYPCFTNVFGKCVPRNNNLKEMDNISDTEIYLIQDLRRRCQSTFYNKGCEVNYPFIYSPNSWTAPISVSFGVDYICVGPSNSPQVSVAVDNSVQIQSVSETVTPPPPRVWGYSGSTGPRFWGQLGFPVCDGTRQSPVNINTNTVSVASNLQSFRYRNYDRKVQGWILLNDGISADMQIQEGDIEISRGGLPLGETYQFQCLHFHWGSDSTQGAEHTLNGKKFPMEAHLVHYKSSLPSFEEAVETTPDGLAVLGFFFEIQEFDNPAYDFLIDKLRNVENPGDKVPIEPFVLNSILPSDLSRYYRYGGSLTNPPCFESVIWTVFEDTVKISERQINSFRTLLKGDDGRIIVTNFRPVQPLNGRRIATQPFTVSSFIRF